MSMLMVLKEGGSLLIDSIRTKIDEDIDLLPETSATGISVGLRIFFDSLFTTSVTSTTGRAIVMEV